MQRVPGARRNWKSPIFMPGLGRRPSSGAALLNTITRELYFTNSSCFNLQAVAGLLTKKTRERLDQFELPRRLNSRRAVH